MLSPLMTVTKTNCGCRVTRRENEGIYWIPKWVNKLRENQHDLELSKLKHPDVSPQPSAWNADFDTPVAWLPVWCPVAGGNEKFRSRSKSTGVNQSFFRLRLFQTWPDQSEITLERWSQRDTTRCLKVPSGTKMVIDFWWWEKPF